MRENCTQGSVGGRLGNRTLYPTIVFVIVSVVIVTDRSIFPCVCREAIRIGVPDPDYGYEYDHDYRFADNYSDYL